MKKTPVIAALVVLAGGAIWAGFLASDDAQNPDRVALYLDPARVAEGAVLYGENCASCHGDNLQGEPDWKAPDSDGYMPAPPHDATGHTWHHPTEQLFAVTKYGTEALVGNGYKSRMAGFEDSLSDDQIYSILAYIKSTWPAQIVERHTKTDSPNGT